jgi:O-antigen ligase
MNIGSVNLERRFVEAIISGTLACLWIATSSATLVESYAYRYSGIILVIFGFYQYARGQRKPSVIWGEWLCIGWGCYAISRFFAQYLLQTDHPIGDADLLYVMPLVFPILGFSLFLCWESLEATIAAYFGVALAALLLTTHYAAIFRGETVRPLIQHNQIHGAVSCGLILIAATFWILHYALAAKASKRYQRYAFSVGPIVSLLCLIGIYGAKSKGVWLALACTCPVILLLMAAWLRPRAIALILIAFAVVTAGTLYEISGNLNTTAGPTLAATIALEKKIATGTALGPAVETSIDDPTTPISMDERLQLWANAWEIYSKAPIFGLGNQWIILWTHAHYKGVKYTMMHDGYLEILVRYGVEGVGVFSAMLFAFTREIARATQRGKAPPVALPCYLVMTFFFSLTLLSNSNNRLAIGESFMLLSSAFALACGLRNRLSLHERRPAELGGNRSFWSPQLHRL